MNGKRTTQKDVARLAGVSQAMVSMVVNGVGDQSVPVETTERIMQAVRELGYIPNRFAQALKTNRTMTIACLVPDITNPFYPDLIRGVQKAVAAQNYDVITMNTDGLLANETHFLDWALQGRVDGVVGVFFQLKAKELAPLLDAGIPVVRLQSSQRKGGNLAIDAIFVDSYKASVHVVERLVAKGHRRIAMVAGDGGPHPMRIEGYSSAVAREGIEPCIVTDEMFNEVGGHRAAGKVLAGGYGPTAIFAANDLMAIGTMLALRENGIRIPEQVAVVGFDDILAARLVTPALTTVDQQQGTMGEKAVEILLERLGGKRTGPGIIREVPFHFIERDSM